MVSNDAQKINELINSTVFISWCENIQLAECVSYLIERSKINGLTPPLGEKILSLLQAHLMTYSVAELSRLIWMAVESASSYSNKPYITIKHASNAIYTILQNNIDKVSTGIWKRKVFNRDTTLPESAIAKVFFSHIFKIHDCSFRYRLSELIASVKTEPLSQEGRSSYLTLGTEYDSNKSMTLQLNVIQQQAN